MRQQLVDTQVLGHREHIKLYEACDLLLSTSKDSGAYGTLFSAANRFKDYFSDNTLCQDSCRVHIYREEK